MTPGSKVVFLSYAHADAEAVTRIYEHLRAAGLEPWMDKFSLPPGSEWRAEIEKAIRRSGAFLSIISPSSLERGGVLRGEMKLALDLRAERLDNGGLLIPVRLEHCQLPQELHHLQALDWYLPDGPAKLIAALAGRLARPSFGQRFRRFAASARGIAAMAVIFAGIGIGGYESMSHFHRAPEYETFLRSRPGSPASPLQSAPPQIGVTVWRVSADNAAGSGVCGFFRFSRQPLTQTVRTGDRLRLDVQASRAGYIYVISREIDGTNRAGPPQLLFPVNTVNNGNNRILPGTALMIPPASDICSTLQLTHAGEGERVAVLFSEMPLDSLPARETPYVIDSGVAASLSGVAAECTRVGVPSTVSSRGIELPDSQSRNLDYASAGPDAVFTSSRATGPAMATFTLKTLK